MKTLKDYVYVDNILPLDLCDEILKGIESEDRKWVKHSWHDESSNTTEEKFVGVDPNYKELDVLHHNLNDFSEIERNLIPFLVKSCEKYCEINSHNSEMVVSSLSNFRFNRYEKDSLMQKTL